MITTVLMETIILTLKHFVLPIFVGTTIGSLIGSKLALKRLSPYEGKTIIDSSEQFKLLCKQLSKTTEEEKNTRKEKIIRPIAEKLSQYISEDNLKLFYSNIKSTKIKRRPLLVLIGIGGSFSDSKNRIQYSLKSALGHEALHAGSSAYDAETGVGLCGFRQYKDNIEIGRGINEGFTELLASRIFNRKKKASAYLKEVKIAKMLEFFFDNPKDMESLYFNCNLPGLVNHLSKSSSKKEVIDLIKLVDKINFAGISVIASLYSVKAQLSLYKMFLATNPSYDKIMAFEKILFKNKIVEAMIKMGNYVESQPEPVYGKVLSI